jgi:tetrahydromethanopterin S-methyltransferase subunit C
MSNGMTTYLHYWCASIWAHTISEVSSYGVGTDFTCSITIGFSRTSKGGTSIVRSYVFCINTLNRRNGAEGIAKPTSYYDKSRYQATEY